MGRLPAFTNENASDLLVMLGTFLVVYMLARFFKVGPLVATCFGVLPPSIGYILLHPENQIRIMALFS